MDDELKNLSAMSAPLIDVRKPWRRVLTKTRVTIWLSRVYAVGLGSAPAPGVADGTLAVRVKRVELSPFGESIRAAEWRARRPPLRPWQARSPFSTAWIQLSQILCPFAYWGAFAATNLPAPETLRDIKGPIVIGSPWAWLWRVLAVGAIAGLIALAWWWYRRGQPEAAKAREISPADRARQRLEAALRWIEDPERFVTEVSEIARTYLEERFGLHAPERTTEEFLAELTTDRSLEHRHKELLADFLTRCDLVKFARADTDRAGLEALYGAAERLVDETAQLPATPAATTR